MGPEFYWGILFSMMLVTSFGIGFAFGRESDRAAIRRRLR